MTETTISFNIMAGQLIIGICIFFFALLAVIWKGKSEIADAIKKEIGDFKQRFMAMESKMEIVWKDKVAPANSPRRLNERGNDILNGSGIKEIIEARKNDFLLTLRTKNLTNPYDAEQTTLDIVNNLKNDVAFINTLKNGAFSVGADIDTVLLVGGLYLRDLVFPELGFSLDDLDKPQKVKSI